jgi:hypothetical protein
MNIYKFPSLILHRLLQQAALCATPFVFLALRLGQGISQALLRLGVLIEQIDRSNVWLAPWGVVINGDTLFFKVGLPPSLNLFFSETVLG